MSYAPRPPYGQVPPKKKMSTTVIVLIVVGAVSLLGLCCVGGGIALLLPAFQQAQQAARNAAQTSGDAGSFGSAFVAEAQLENEFKVLGLAYHLHMDGYGSPQSWEDLSRVHGIDAGALQSLRAKNVEVRWGVNLGDLQSNGTPLSDFVLAYPANAASETSTVLMGDGHVETLSPEAFQAKLDQYPVATTPAAES